MLPLRYLFDRRELAISLLSSWGYDADRLQALDRYRISANAIYPFYRQGQLCFLRFAPTSEKSPNSVRAELDFLRFLRSTNYSAPVVIPSQEGDEIVVRTTEEKEYVAVVFATVPGKRMDQIELTPEIGFGYGRQLATLHECSRRFVPGVQPRPDWQQILDRVETLLRTCAAPDVAMNELEAVRKALSALPVSPETYGLIHYDYELDNVFYDATSGLYATIDFDDCVYHWYAMDVEQAFDNLREELDAAEVELVQSAFLEGYRSVRPLHEELWAQQSWFRRYAELYNYTRCLYSTMEHFDHEPDWMTNLRAYLGQHMEHQLQGFQRALRP